MASNTLIDKIINNKIICLIVSSSLLLGFLGSHDIWTHESRWVDIVTMMFLRHDYLHPYLVNDPYYDKPLFTYWLIALSASLTKSLSLFSLRLPSAIAGMIGLMSSYTIAKKCYDKETGLFFVWMLISLYSYIFWARTASSDIYNLAGILLAIAIYLSYREKPSFTAFLYFFLTTALTSLCKGIVAAVVIFIVVGIDVLLRNTWKNYLRPALFLAFLLGLLVFIFPYCLSSYFPDANFASSHSGFYMLYQENILRFFKPFDHQGPIYLYLIYLPIYLFPWILFFIPALWMALRNFSHLNLNSRWILLSFIALFLFFTLSGSRRSYYILPLLPFALLIILDWFKANPGFQKAANQLAILFVSILIGYFLVLQPFYFTHYSLAALLQNLRQEQVNKNDILLLGVKNKVAFYLQIPANEIKPVSQIQSIVSSLSSLPKFILLKKADLSKLEPIALHYVESKPKKMPLPLFSNLFTASSDTIVLIRKESDTE